MTTHSASDLHVIFGTGPVGLATARALLGMGITNIRMVNRSGKSADAPQGVQIVAADVYTPSQAISAAARAAVVYQCAQPAYHEWAEKFPPLQASIMGAAAAAGAKFIVADNLYSYGDVDGPLHENLPARATGKKGATRAAMAQAVLDAHKAGTVRSAIARASDFYGPNVMGSLVGDRLFGPLLAGKPAQMVGNPDLPHTITYIDDYGMGLAVLATRESALGQIWHVPNAAPITQRQMVALAAKAAGVEPKISAMGKTMMRIGGLFIPAAKEMIELWYEFDKAYIVDDSKFRRAFPDVITGNTPMPLEEGFRRAVAWFRAHVASKAA
ncbi:MAG: NAD-dependent epimerase/dehydratase family protein [Pleurocapsa minor GSE-CHR-MK-17-07R]|jgi:nucleoside-diphosphate-sugar epimerase|nr:NAD-dependent epimerase/dehydratase family protein [Pleurocapsa minor GSE-CHR-MK 17-07R]